MDGYARPHTQCYGLQATLRLLVYRPWLVASFLPVVCVYTRGVMLGVKWPMSPHQTCADVLFFLWGVWCDLPPCDREV